MTPLTNIILVTFLSAQVVKVGVIQYYKGYRGEPVSTLIFEVAGTSGSLRVMAFQ